MILKTGAVGIDPHIAGVNLWTIIYKLNYFLTRAEDLNLVYKVASAVPIKTQ